VECSGFLLFFGGDSFGFFLVFGFKGSGFLLLFGGDSFGFFSYLGLKLSLDLVTLPYDSWQHSFVESSLEVRLDLFGEHFDLVILLELFNGKLDQLQLAIHVDVVAAEFLTALN